MRPRGSYGEVALALKQAAMEGPGPVRELAQRACVGYSVARYTCSRLVDRGELMVIEDRRPAVLAVAPRQADMADQLSELQRRFFNGPPADADEPPSFGAL